MTVLACVEVNLARNPLGLASRALADLGGKPVLRRVCEALRAVRAIDATAVVTRPRDAAAVSGALAGLPVTIHASDAPDVPQRGALRRARKWSRFGWRGGLHWTTAFDEHGWPRALLEAALAAGADSVAVARAEAPLLDPALTDALVRHHLRYRKTYFMTFAQAPVGLVPEAYTIDFLKTMAATNQTPLEVLRYKPDRPEMDRIRAECHFDCGDRIRRAPFRMTADSRRGLEALRTLWARADDPERTPAEMWVTLAARHADAWLGDAPPFASVEIVREPGICPVPPERPLPTAIDPETVARLLAGLSGWDDVCLTLEGFGDPLAHPAFPAIADAIRRARPYGVHLVTPGARLTDEALDLLFDLPVDVVEVPFGRRATPPAEDARVRDNLDRFLARRREAPNDAPFLVAALPKRRDTEPEAEAFFDAWLARGAWPVFRSVNAYAGQVADRPPLPTNLARRIPCVKIASELYVDTAGEVLVCREDLAARRPVAPHGAPEAMALRRAWREGTLAALRAAHREGRWDAFPLCPPCTEWDRL